MITVNDILKDLNLNSSRIIRKPVSKEIWDMKEMMKAFQRIGSKWVPIYAIDQSNEHCIHNLVSWLLNDPEMTAIEPNSGRLVKGRLDKGIYLAGNTGSGKSLVMKILAMMESKIGIAGTDKIPTWIEVRADEVVSEFAANGYESLAFYKKAPVLCIQDLGAEPNEVLYMGNRVNVMKLILESRGDRLDQMTLITSNLPINCQENVARYGERVVSRLMEMCNYLTLVGEDRRIHAGR